MILYIDIDNTICLTTGTDYGNATPILSRIEIINALYDNGLNTIVYWTGRGQGSGLDHSELTKKQLQDWNCKYHELLFGKPVFDIFIDNKAINSEKFFDNLDL